MVDPDFASAVFYEAKMETRPICKGICYLCNDRHFDGEKKIDVLLFRRSR